MVYSQFGKEIIEVLKIVLCTSPLTRTRKKILIVFPNTVHHSDKYL